MDDDLIVIDDVDVVESQPGPSSTIRAGAVDTQSFYANSRPRSVAERSLASSRLRSSSNPPTNPPMETSERMTRSSIAKPKAQPKLKLKLSEKAAAQAPGMSFLGQYDRELDSDDDDLAFEEQFILRMSSGEDAERLRKSVASREVANDVWFKFKGESQHLWFSTLNDWWVRLSKSCVSHRQ
jgi:transcription initiation factor TFIID subunit 7